MVASLFFKACLIGLSIAAPVGPIGLLCIQRSLSQGMRIGFATGMGAALADGMYGLIGALGVAALIHFLVAARVWLGLFGGLFLIWMGMRLLRRVGQPQSGAPDKVSALRAFASTFVLTLSNPSTILSFIAVFASLSASGPANTEAATIVTMVVGVFIGSAAWWLLLSSFVGHVGRRLPDLLPKIVSPLAGVVLVGFGLYQLGLVFT
jgi:threonine/homoserine/homoserine lactone efflux protein